MLLWSCHLQWLCEIEVLEVCALRFWKLNTGEGHYCNFWVGTFSLLFCSRYIQDYHTISLSCEIRIESEWALAQMAPPPLVGARWRVKLWVQDPLGACVGWHHFLHCFIVITYKSDHIMFFELWNEGRERMSSPLLVRAGWRMKLWVQDLLGACVINKRINIKVQGF